MGSLYGSPYQGLNFLRNLFFIKGVNLWNYLNEDIRNITELSELKKELMLCTQSDNIDNIVSVVY